MLRIHANSIIPLPWLIYSSLTSLSCHASPSQQPLQSMWNLWRSSWTPMPAVLPPIPVGPVPLPVYPSSVSLPYSIKASTRSSRDRFSGGPFSEVFKFVYTNLNSGGTCTLELHQKGVADRVEEVRVKLLDKADGYDAVDAEVVAVRDVATAGVSCWMTVHSSNYHRRKGVRHFSSGEQWTTEGIPYLSASRYGMLAFDKQIVDDPCFDQVDIRHKYTTVDSGLGVRFRVQVRPDPSHHKGLLVNIHSPGAHAFSKIYKDINFLNNCPIAPLGGDRDGGKVAQVNTANPNSQPQPAGSYSNSGQQNMTGLVNSSGYTNGVGNNAVNIYTNCHFGRQDSKK